jgi:cell wall-associated NlpC family hydrolase
VFILLEKWHMVSISELQTAITTDPDIQYQCCDTINLYDSPMLESLATQSVAGRQLRILSFPSNANQAFRHAALQVQLCEDGYQAWMASEDIDLLQVARSPYQAIALSAAEIDARIPKVITFALSAMNQPNHYLWGGTVGPHYDCSGLVQASFVSAGIWLPRDSYQQEAFTEKINDHGSLRPGDLVFFGPPKRATHVGIYLGEQYYIHSSGRDHGRNGIAIDALSFKGDAISQAYYRQFRQAGRVVKSYQP